MTREKALEVSDLMFRIERYENLIEDIRGLDSLYELKEVFGEDTLEAELIAVIQPKIDAMLKELEENY